MTHQTIQARGWVEAYVERRLTPQDNAAFEEHYFQCDLCFTEVQEIEKFVAGMRQAAARGPLNGPVADAPRWLLPSLAFSTVAFAAALCFVTLVHVPVGREAAPQPNVPVAILTADRAPGSRNSLLIDPAARIAMLWIDIPPQPAGVKLDLTIASGDQRVSKSVTGLERNSNGALALALPVRELPAGAYVVRIFLADQRLLAEYQLDIAVRK